MSAVSEAGSIYGSVAVLARSSAAMIGKRNGFSSTALRWVRGSVAEAALLPRGVRGDGATYTYEGGLTIP
jgi:hypothetical protein